MRQSTLPITHVRLAAALALASGVGAGTSCAVPNKGHCLYQGGDAWCRQQDRGSACYILVDDSMSSPSIDGCYEAESAELERHVHVKYGLPSYVLNEDAGLDAGEESFATIEGIQAVLVGQGVLEPGCVVSLDGLESQVEVAKALRRDLEPKKTESKDDTRQRNADSRVRFDAMNAAIDERFDPCLASGGTDTGTGTDTGGTATETGDTDGTTTTGDESSSGSSTTGPMPCMGDEECTDPAAPVCGEDGVCVPCDQGPIPANGDAACAAVDPMTPVCFEGTCVECTASVPDACTDQLLLCDEMTNACVPCTEHDQCDSGACEIAVGTCFPPGTPVSVDGDGPSDFNTIEAALAALGGTGVIILHQQGAMGQTPYLVDALTIGGGKIAILAAPGENPRIQGTNATAAGLTVSGAGTVVYLEGIRISQSTAWGLDVDGAFAWVDRGRIVQNGDGGVLVQSVGDATLRNTFVGGADNTAAVQVTGSSASVLYSTIGGGTITATGFSCTAPQAIDVRNSIIVALGIGATGGDDVACSGGMVTYSYTASEVALPGIGNVGVGEMPLMTPQDWFANYANGDFHLQNMGPTLFDVAQWSDGDPAFDIDGDARPSVDGSPDHAGADVP